MRSPAIYEVINGINNRYDMIWDSFETIGCYAEWVNCGMQLEETEESGINGRNIDKAAVMAAYIEKLKRKTMFKL